MVAPPTFPSSPGIVPQELPDPAAAAPAAGSAAAPATAVPAGARTALPDSALRPVVPRTPEALREAMQPMIAHLREPDAQLVQRAWDFAQTLYGARHLPNGENILEHAFGILRILDHVRADAPARAAGVLFSAAELLGKPDEQLFEAFGREVTDIALGVRQLARLGEMTRQSTAGGKRSGGGNAGSDARAAEQQVETLRKMLIAFASDIRVVLVRLASRLQTLRYLAQAKAPVSEALARESLQLYAPLANRLGVWQVKWELEDLSFRFLHPETYRSIARMLDEKRVEREAFIERTIARLSELLAASGISAEVSGRPKHIYSIWNKMQHKGVSFDGLYDVRGLRVIVDDEKACYAALALIHATWTPLLKEFDDYIARPKNNGYMSLHTVLTDADGRPFEVQIRTRAMHRFAEFGVAAHWRYKEKAGSGQDSYDDKIAWLRQLLAWRSEVAGAVAGQDEGEGQDGATSAPAMRPAGLDDRIYVLTPQARVIELPAGATPVDFAYHLHTDLGHRCRGARVDGAMVPLNTPLKSGQTVEIIAAKAGVVAAGPSRDWLNPQLNYLQSPRARAKVRAWFNALDLAETVAVGRAQVEKLLQREGRTATNLEALAGRLGYASPDEFFAAVAKDEVSLRGLESQLDEGGTQAEAVTDAPSMLRPSRPGSVATGGKSGVLVVGVDALLTQLAKCCKPAPPDEIVGFVTRGKGISIHRSDCSNLRTLVEREPQRVIEVAWGRRAEGTLYPVDVAVMANDRQGLLRDISEVFSREKLNVIGVNTQSQKSVARMAFTVEVGDALQLRRALAGIAEVPGVFDARRK